jgi:protocatechuate 3,4-dioxygenase beta subunit
MTRNRLVNPLSRRQTLGLLGAAGLVGCAGGGSSSSTSSTTTGSSGSGSAVGGSTGTSCVLIPQETEGPYPLWNDIATASTYMRQDITEGHTGIPLNLILSLVNVNNSCAPITNALVYVWHTDKDGLYSGYNQQGTSTVGQTFCRGVQMCDSNGQVRFTTIYPGWYTGRITHIHFRVYLGNALEATSQLAFPQDITTAVYNTSLYAARGQNRSVSSFSADGIFADGVQYQLATVSENASIGGYDASLSVGVAL